MRESMARLTPRFSANRTVREYTERFYLPAASAYHLRIANHGAIGRQRVALQQSMEQKWAAVRFGDVKVETQSMQHVFEVPVYLDDLDPKAVHVELYADRVNGGDPVRQEMTCAGHLAGASGGYVYRAAVSAGRPAKDYTARIIPQYSGGADPLRIGAYPMATMTKTSQRNFLDRISRFRSAPFATGDSLASGRRHLWRSPAGPVAPGTEPLWEDPRTYHLRPRSSAILLARQTDTQERLVTKTQTKLNERKDPYYVI